MTLTTNQTQILQLAKKGWRTQQQLNANFGEIGTLIALGKLRRKPQTMAGQTVSVYTTAGTAQ